MKIDEESEGERRGRHIHRERGAAMLVVMAFVLLCKSISRSCHSKVVNGLLRTFFPVRATSTAGYTVLLQCVQDAMYDGMKQHMSNMIAVHPKQFWNLGWKVTEIKQRSQRAPTQNVSIDGGNIACFPQPQDSNHSFFSAQ